MSSSSSPHPHEQGTPPQTVDSAAVEVCFTVEEVAQVCALRQYFQTHPDHGDSDAAIRRLEFARWRVQHGKLSDGCAQQSGPGNDALCPARLVRRPREQIRTWSEGSTRVERQHVLGASRRGERCRPTVVPHERGAVRWTPRNSTSRPRLGKAGSMHDTDR